MSAKPRCMPPNNLSVAARHHFVAADGQLKRPHFRRHPPQHEAPILPTSRPHCPHAFTSRNLRFTAYQFDHPRRVHVLGATLLLRAPRCC